MSLSIDELREAFEVNIETGDLLWRIPHGRWGRIPPGPAGSAGPKGRLVVDFKGKTRLVHRIIWAIAHGAWPPEGMEIDHVDRDCHNNRLSNLRLATQSEQMCNRGAQKSNTSGVSGVSWDRTRSRWLSRVYKDNKVVWVRRFAAFNDAVLAIKRARLTYHGEFSGDLTCR